MAATRAEGQQQNDVKLGGEAAAAATTAKCARKQSTGASNSGVTGPNKNQHLQQQQQQQQAQTQQQQAEQAPDPPPPDKGARGAAHHQLLGSYATATPNRVGADSAPAGQDHHDANYSSAPPPAHQSDQSDSNPTPQPPDQQSIGQHQPPDHYTKHDQQQQQPRLAHLGQPPPPQQFQPQPRFLSGQSISQSTGPTPTLNQLLQASSPMHRFHTGYSAIPPEGYQQPWPPMQRPGVPGPPVYAQQPSQRPPQTSSPRLHPGPGGPSSPTPMSYQPYPQRYPSPARPHSPYGHHQLNSYPPQGNHPSNMYPEQRGWNQSGPPNPPPPPTNQQNPSSQSPQRALSQSPAPPPSASPQPQPAQSQNFHSMQQRSTTPNTQGIDSGELSGQNSNDSSNGPAGPGTPNSQGMRPTPSPTGSTGSRSMSPAVGQQNVQMPPRPSSSQSDGSGPARMSHSPMTTQGGYQQPLGPSPHMHNYKMNSSGPGVVQAGPGQTGLGGMNPMAGGMGYAGGAAGANQPGAGYPQGSYPPPRPHMQFPQGYPPQPANSQPPPNNQYQPARPNNLVQYPPYPHKMGFNSVPPGMPPSPGPPQVYGGPAGGGPGGGMVAPGMGNMGPPTSSMGPPPPSPNHVSNQQPQSQPPAPSMPPSGGGGTSGPPPMQQSSHSHPPAATPPLSQEGPGPGHGAPSPMPPPSTTPNSHAPPPNAQTPIHSSSADLATESSNDSGITTTASGTAAINVSSTSSGTVTSVITTGPDGTSLDEGSQQSTLSNASAASGEDPAFTPKVRKDMMGGYHSHPTTPQSTVPSPSAASINSIHEEYSDMSSPGWPRTPASPVFNSHVPQDPYRSKKPDSLAKLYEMDDTLERRSWLDKLVSFMEERRTPITSCPTISKNPLDLFRLYLYVKERGGFMEVTKNKTWKDIAGLLGIGASSSAAYTLRKHYTKHLLAYECHFDRGGVDPQPIINQVEAGSKKKGTKGTASVPSPGSSNSQDSFPAAGSSNTSMDGYGSYQSNYSGGAPGGPASEYTPPNRPPSQSSAPSPHQGMQQGNYQNAGSFQNYPQDQYIRPQGGSMAQPGDFNQPYSPRSHYPPYVTDNERGYSGGNMPPNNAGPQDMYNRYGGGQQAASYPQAAPPSARNSNYPPAPQSHPPGAQQPPSSCQPPSSQASAAPTYSCPQDYYRQDQGGYGGPGAGQIYSTAANKNMPPPPPGPQQPRRHPDFAKDQQQYPQYNQQRPAYPGWPGATNQYNSGPAGPGAGSGPGARLQYPSQQPASTGPPNTMPPQQSQQQPQQQPPPPPQQQPQPPSNAAAPTVQQMQQPPQAQGHPHVHPHAHPQHPQPPPQQQAPAVGPAPSAAPPQSQMPPMPQMPPVPAAPPNAQQWSTQQPSRPSSQPSINAMPPHPPSPWDHRYPSQPTPTPLYPPPGPHQSQLGMGPVMSQQQAAPKREMTFPPDSVEAVTPLHYKRRKLTRQDVSPVEAWRIMMALRSGLLAESCWALDVLNILLFDDSSIQYFGLANLPGLLDVLLEHFSRSLSDMFEMSTPEDDKSSWNEKSTNGPEVDLGAVTRPIDTEDRTKLLSCSNYTFLSRRGRPVKMIPRDEDLFVLDSKRQWDHQDQEPETEPWQVDPSATKYIITCFQSEISSNTFARHLRDEKPPLLQKEVDNMETKDEESKFDGNANADSLDSSCSSSSASSNGSTTCPFTRKGVANDVVRKELTVVKQQNDKKKKTKSLSDVLSRIKREPTEMNDLTRELFEKKNDGSKRDCENDVANNPTKANNKAGERFNELLPPKIEPEEPVYTNDNGNSMEKDEETTTAATTTTTTTTTTTAATTTTTTTTTMTTPCRNDAEDSQNEELKPERAKDRDKEKESKEKDKEEGEKEGENEKEEKKEETEAERQRREWKEKIARLKVKDPAGTLKRRRISDYEDESYSRDEASLYLVTETQDSLARRCVCLSTILRNLTFIPGNEGEFTKNVTFLSILGKLLLLHHEHPVRTQKTRNYDREEDADFADSCSSLQGEGEWWWDFLYHIRENVLVMSANISGYMDLSLHPEEISRPVLDGLLHWAVCPAAHGQDPFPTVSLNSSLSPQRLALEALCKLCVTESNVDLVVATPPYSRLQRLCSVLTRLLCRSEEQPMREFAVNLLHFLSAADSGVARTIALQTPCVAHLVAFIEQAESSAIGVANQHGLAALRDNPESMGTSLDMLRRAAATLLNLARHPDNRTLLLQHESRLLALVMSQILDQQVAAIVARVLYQCSRGSSST